MPLEESPSLNKYKQGLPLEISKPKNRRVVTWIIIAVLFFITIALALFLYFKNHTIVNYTGDGIVTGQVVGERNQPIEAQILILGTDIEGVSDIDGYFEISEVPVGDHSIVILYQGSGWEYPTTISTGQVTNIGKIKIVPTSEPIN
jgi:hypothetical protein